MNGVVNKPKENPFSELINDELSSIEFVRDYIQFRFDGPVLTAITDPEILVNGISHKRESKDFCNLLLECIGQIIVSATIEEGKSIVIMFGNKYSLFISLTPESYVTAEAATYRDKVNELWVW